MVPQSIMLTAYAIWLLHKMWMAVEPNTYSTWVNNIGVSALTILVVLDTLEWYCYALIILRLAIDQFPKLQIPIFVLLIPQLTAPTQQISASLLLSHAFRAIYTPLVQDR